MNILYIGDPHVQIKNIDESERLMLFIEKNIIELKPDKVIILGDLAHTHSIVRLEVLEFWEKWLDRLTDNINTEFIVLCGNHDMASPKIGSSNFLLAFKHMNKKNLRLIKSNEIDGIFAYVSYYADNDTFIDISNRLFKEGAKVLVCHQTFDGSQYDNGFYAPDGIDIQKLQFNLIVSGHIHKHQKLSKYDKLIIYPGTPKWDNYSDANEIKGLWVYEHDDENGYIINEKFISTSGPCTPILNLVWEEGKDKPEIQDGAKIFLEMIGSSEWIEKEKINFKGHVSIKTRIINKNKKNDRQTGNSFSEFLYNLFKTELDRKELFQYMKDLEIV